MKKIINGKVYDTQKAECVGKWNNGLAGFDWCEEELYRKRTGEFFLFGQGSARSRYAKSCGDNEWSGGGKIIPMSYQAAQKWAEDKLNAEQYEAIFGAVQEDDSRVTVTLSLSASSVERAKRAAAQAGISLSSYIEGLI